MVGNTIANPYSAEQLCRRDSEMIREQQAYWICCPICGKKTKTRVYEDTVLLKYPLYCTKCKIETIINVVKLKTVISDEPDE